MSNDLSRKDKLCKRLRYLWTWELFDSLFFPPIVISGAKTLQASMGLFTIYSAGLVTWMLWQGAAYWRLKLRAVQTDSEIEAKHLRWFQMLKKVNWVLIGVLPVLLGGKGLIDTFFSSGFDFIAGLGLYTLAVLEQINYYHYQLMYDYLPDWRYLIQNKKLRRSSLNRALEKLNDEEKS